MSILDRRWFEPRERAKETNPDFIAYVAGAFSAKTREGVEENIRAAVDVGILVARAGFCPMVPHSNTAHPMYEAVQDYLFWIAATAAQLRFAHAVVMVPGWTYSSGACGELDLALLRGIPVFMSVGDLVAWARRNGVLAQARGLELAA